MSEEPYYQYPSTSVSRPDGVSLPSFPSTTYWYDAHSNEGLTYYSQQPPVTTITTSSGGHNYNYKPESINSIKHVENGKHLPPINSWTNGLQQDRMQKIDEGYWIEPPQLQESYFPAIPEYNVNEQSYEYESLSNRNTPLQPVISDIRQDERIPTDINEDGNYYQMNALSPYDSDNGMSNASVISSTDYCQLSTSSNDGFPLRHDNQPSPPATSQPVIVSPEDPANIGNKRQKKEVPEKQSKDDKRCGVCGDVARSMHFGGMACDSCKAFFRRSVQSGAYKNFQCPENANCPISKQNRKICQFCRFKKSKDNGMEISWVMSETDRMTLWKNRLAKQRYVNEEKMKEEVYGDLPRTLNPKEADKLKNLAALQESTFKSIEYPADCYGDDPDALANIFVVVCKKLGHFFRKIEDNKTICKHDQGLLIKNGVGMSIYLHGAYMYDTENESWPAAGIKDALKMPPVSMSTLRALTQYTNVYEAIMKFYRKYGKEFKDEIILALMCVIAFFQPDDPQYQYPEKIQEIQVTYLEHLRRYLSAKEGDQGVKATFPKLLVGLADVKEILEFHNEVDIKPTINHQQVSTNVSYKNQMTSLQDVMARASQGLLSEFSSVLTPYEKQLPMWRRNEKSISKRQRQRSNTIVRGGDQLYHSQTNQIFGSGLRTDMIISSPMEQINQFMKKHRLSIAQVSEITDFDSECGASSSSYYKKGDHYSTSHYSNREPNQSEYEMEPASSSRQLQLIPANHSYNSVTTHSRSGNTNSISPSSADKKLAVEVLCDILKHISCFDDDDGMIIQSLKQHLPPHLLQNLAQKLSPT